MEEIVSKNRRSATELPHKIDILQNANGKYFFTSGDMVGYVTAKTAEGIINREYSREDLQVADVSIDGGKTFVTCLMKRGANVLASL